MVTTIQEVTSTDDGIEAEREIIRQGLNEIAKEVGSRLREASLNHPIYLTVPNSGDALALFCTPSDLPDAEWLDIKVIVRQVVSERLSGQRLRSRELICASAGAPINVADITAE